MEGGQYKPLTQRDMERIHEAALTLLETVGFGQAIPTCIEAMTARGCTMTDKGRLLHSARARRRYSGELRPRLRAPWPRSQARHGAHRATRSISERRARRFTSSSPTRAPTASRCLVDLYDAGRIVDTCEHIHFFQRCLTARDMITGHDLDINTLYACLASHAKACRHLHG